MDNLDYFVTDGVYTFYNAIDSLFVCIPVGGNLIGRLMQYKKCTNTMYERTSVSYFLNCYDEADVKSIFLDRARYDMVGKIGVNYKFSDNGQYLLVGE